MVVAEEPSTFFDGGFDVSGVEVTVHPAEALPGLEVEANAEAMGAFRVNRRELDRQCTTVLAPVDLALADFVGAAAGRTRRNPAAVSRSTPLCP